MKLLCQINGGIAQERLILLRMPREDETLKKRSLNVRGGEDPISLRKQKIAGQV